MKLPKNVVIYLSCILLCCACASSKSVKRKPPVKISGPTLCKSIQRQDYIVLAQDPTNTFSPYDKQVVAHLLFEYLSGSHQIRWEWYDPKGKLYYATENVPLETSQAKYVKQATVWHTLTINGDKASTLPGQWKVSFYLNDELYDSKYFTIKHLKHVVPPLPVKGSKRSANDWGLVIGIENYSRLPIAEYARNDALIIKKYFQKILGIPAENLIYLIDSQATKAQIEGYLEQYLPKNVKSNSTVYVYFAGHGAPDKNSGDPYLVPYDGDPRFLGKSGYKLKKLYRDLNSLRVKRSFVFLDACFSGIARGTTKKLVEGRPILIHVNEVNLASDAVVSMSATSAKQTSVSYNKAEHGLFTFFLLWALSGEADDNNDRWVSVMEAYEYVAENVTNMAKREGKDQTPEITPSLNRLKNLNLNKVVH